MNEEEFFYLNAAVVSRIVENSLENPFGASAAITRVLLLLEEWVEQGNVIEIGHLADLCSAIADKSLYY